MPWPRKGCPDADTCRIVRRQRRPRSSSMPPTPGSISGSQYTDRVDKAADERGAFFDHLRLIRVRGLVAEQLNDPDFRHPGETRKTTHDRARGGKSARTKDERG
jgi:hypothetical protein